ncbi:glycine cleavage system protein GcvH [Ruania alba]|uniref:Glycine cleavage system H protein n=1 Tax=Ruania alba TaxID=648782 RepID=A0A1H5FIU4_9MICO|nr:glycine cleavage system protein GcvH [Ruania alba]SEE03064.1 glycine cleavage system H protein [Ruania alba]
MNVPEDRQYTAEHEWVRLSGGVATVGITAHAASALGDVVFVELPAVGDTVTAGESCGEIESTKSVSELYAPVTGEVIEVNSLAVDTPEQVNDSPYDGGWLFRVDVGDVVTGQLLDAAAYRALIET